MSVWSCLQSSVLINSHRKHFTSKIEGVLWILAEETDYLEYIIITRKKKPNINEYMTCMNILTMIQQEAQADQWSPEVYQYRMDYTDQ